jgi:hypothetical protein
MGIEELIPILERVCTEHLVMRKLLREHKETAHVREMCRLPHYRDAFRDQLRGTLDNTQHILDSEVTTAQLLGVLSATNLEAPLPPPENPAKDPSWR